MIGGLDIFFDKAELAAIESLRRYLDEQLEPELAAHGEDFVPKDKMQSWTNLVSSTPHSRNLPAGWGCPGSCTFN